MAQLLRQFGRQSCLFRHHGALLQKSVQPMASATAYEEMSDFWAKNRKLNRPLSPHLSIYKPQLTSMLSLCHRVTGIIMGVTVPAVAAMLLVSPGDFTTYITMIRDLNLSPALIAACKYILGFPVIYHYINGIRHLAWDWAVGFSLKDTYRTGYFVFALSLFLTAICVHFV
ncbi:succinate dehydrogenase (ubiquinone) cytochrome b560 subunit [Mytilus galloprovincialis]|uniref:Succinate dehydrogenase (Ubiquinone) cytochrome b560 subunit n=2 Tax=Mytilus galloprovincialis TaxID=29158 RepID=A0A8B6HKE5_MYTGA|nr:succinate dehydrogenase (ubiquinone) cytochrome b560 subunit [Mytilus galloprovincialis]